MNQLYRVVAIPLNSEGKPTHNEYASSTLARSAVQLTGVIAAAWTQGVVEALIYGRDAESALNVMDYAAYVLHSEPRMFVVNGDRHSYLAGLAEQVSELTGAPSYGTSTEPHSKVRGMLWNSGVEFESKGITESGLIAAMAGMVSER